MMGVKYVALLGIFLCLAGCETLGVGRDYDFHAITDCAKQHPPPPKADVDRLGLLPVYLTHSGDVGDPAVKQWFVDMDACTAKYQAAKKK